VEEQQTIDILIN